MQIDDYSEQFLEYVADLDDAMILMRCAFFSFLVKIYISNDRVGTFTQDPFIALFANIDFIADDTAEFALIIANLRTMLDRTNPHRYSQGISSAATILRMPVFITIQSALGKLIGDTIDKNHAGQEVIAVMLAYMLLTGLAIAYASLNNRPSALLHLLKGSSANNPRLSDLSDTFSDGSDEEPYNGPLPSHSFLLPTPPITPVAIRSFGLLPSPDVTPPRVDADGFTIGTPDIYDEPLERSVTFPVGTPTSPVGNSSRVARNLSA
ncbi:MAG TPA: hypothetical protein VLG38_07100 [Gammaproteobacteria bacterium]|nr:hypothetical protein [Gammaproteobacteria bacterium]